MPPSKLDSIYRRMLITRFFEKGWGKPENLQRLFEFRKVISKRETCYKLIPEDYTVDITKEEKNSECRILEGRFQTPLELYLPGVVPKVAQKAYFQVLLPNKWNHPKHKPICIHLAGTGDHFYWRRRNLIAKPLLKEANIGAILLENPFYGLRKPDNQVRSNLHNVSDIFVMGGCLILECLVLLHWCERNGFGPLGVTGLSMGGHMASLAATNWPKPLVLVPCLSWSTASTVFTTGVMSQSINWDMLETQYYSNGHFKERLSQMVTVVDDAFSAGQNFIKNFRQSLHELQQDINETKLLNKVPAIKNGKNKDVNPVTETMQQKTDLVAPDIENDNRRIKEVRNLGKLAVENNIAPIKPQLQKFKKTEPNALTKLMTTILPINAQSQNDKIDITRTNWWEREALQFMRGMMDECTHLKNFSIPYDPSLVIAVCAKDDAYVPREGCSSLEEIWPGIEVRYLDAGHVSAYVLHQKLFRSCIIEAFERAKKVYENEIHVEEALKPNVSYNELISKYAQSFQSVEA